jgi:hypothetical protein
MTESVPFSAVVEFVARQRNSGRYNASTGQNIQRALSIIEPLLEPGSDTVGFVSQSLDDLIHRYGNLNPTIGQASLDAYRSRVKRAIEDYVGHRTDPQYRPPSRARRNRDPEETAAGDAKPASPARTPDNRRPVELPPEDPGSLRHRLPLRSDFDVEIVLPRDFSVREAKRVIGWITALAVEEPSSEKATDS